MQNFVYPILYKLFGSALSARKSSIAIELAPYDTVNVVVTVLDRQGNPVVDALVSIVTVPEIEITPSNTAPTDTEGQVLFNFPVDPGTLQVGAIVLHEGREIQLVENFTVPAP